MRSLAVVVTWGVLLATCALTTDWRPCGYGPDAWPPAVSSDEVGAPGPLTIPNPYVSFELRAAITGDQGPLRILNPYVVKPGDPIVAAAVLPRPMPQVIHPAAEAGRPQ